MPSVPGVPSLPSVPGVPSLPSVPGVPSLPVALPTVNLPVFGDSGILSTITGLKSQVDNILGQIAPVNSVESQVTPLVQQLISTIQGAASNVQALPQGLDLNPVDALQLTQAVAAILSGVVVTLNQCANGTISLTVLAQLDAALKVLLVNLEVVVVGIIAEVVALIVNINVNVFVQLRLLLTVHVLGLAL
jgi:hypothetical protein